MADNVGTNLISWSHSSSFASKLVIPTKTRKALSMLFMAVMPLLGEHLLHDYFSYEPGFGTCIASDLKSDAAAMQCVGDSAWPLNLNVDSLGSFPVAAQPDPEEPQEPDTRDIQHLLTVPSLQHEHTFSSFIVLVTSLLGTLILPDGQT